MSTKSTIFAPYGVVYSVDGGRLSAYPDFVCLHEFFTWLKGLGEVRRIVHTYTDWYESYTFFVGKYEVLSMLPVWVTDKDVVDFFGCSVVLLYGGDNNG